MAQAVDLRAEDLRGYVDYLRDLGIFDLYAIDAPSAEAAVLAWHAQLRSAASSAGSGERKAPAVRPADASAASHTAQPTPFERSRQRSAASLTSPVPGAGSATPLAPPVRPAAQPSPGGRGIRPSGPQITITPPAVPVPPALLPMEEDGQDTVAAEMAPVSFNLLAPLPASRVASADRAGALQHLRADIGDCTRCPLAYAGRHTIVFGDGSPSARLMFVGEGPGADEDETGVPFVGKAGQLLNNMIGAMGLKREDVYIANIVKCRPPKNRVPEPVEAGTCSQFLLQQIDIVQPEVIVALGATAATYLLGVKQSLSSLRGQWFDVRGARAAVTYHPAYLLRDPRQKGEAWKDLQRVMLEMKLAPPPRV